jgi:hypothetical protein
MTAYAANNNLYCKDILKVEGAEVVAGGKITDLRLDKVSYKEKKPEIQFLSIPGYENIEYQFIIKGKGDVTFNYESRKAGNVSQTIKL